MIVADVESKDFMTALEYMEYIKKETIRQFRRDKGGRSYAI